MFATGVSIDFSANDASVTVKNPCKIGRTLTESQTGKNAFTIVTCKAFWGLTTARISGNGYPVALDC